ncbi:MAG: DinB family protein [Caldilinea sp.]
MLDDNVIRTALRSQYGAALAMLRSAVTNCPPSIWEDAADKNRFWHVAYHALFYTHLYLHSSFEEFTPWSRHREEYESMDKTPTPRYEQVEVLDFLDECKEFADKTMTALDLDAPSGFYWLRMNKLELQIYNIRHIQLHAGELAERLSQRAAVDVHWVSTG